MFIIVKKELTDSEILEILLDHFATDEGTNQELLLCGYNSLEEAEKFLLRCDNIYGKKVSLKEQGYQARMIKLISSIP